MKLKTTENKYLSLIAKIFPLVPAALIYIFFAIFGVGDRKTFYLIISPVASVFAFGAVYVLLMMQNKYFEDPRGFWRVAELVYLLLFVFCCISTVLFFTDLKLSFSPFYPMGWCMLSAFSFVYCKKDI